MAVDDDQRQRLYDELAGVLSAESVTAMADLLEPEDDPGVTARFDQVDAQLRDLGGRMDGLETRMDGLETRMDGLETRMDGLETRMGRVETRLDGLDTRMDGLDTRVHSLELATTAGFREVDLKLDGLKHEIVAAFRGEVVAAVSNQTRSVIAGMIAATLSVLLLGVGFSQLL